jgi:hypothetical protein
MKEGKFFITRKGKREKKKVKWRRENQLTVAVAVRKLNVVYVA